MTRKYSEENLAGTVPIYAVSYYLDENSYLPGMIRPHTYKGWHAHWKACGPNGSNLSGQVVGPYNTRDEAIEALNLTYEQIMLHKQSVKDQYDKGN